MIGKSSSAKGRRKRENSFANREKSRSPAWINGSNWFTPRTLDVSPGPAPATAKLFCGVVEPIPTPSSSHAHAHALENRTSVVGLQSKTAENFGLFLGGRQEAAEHFFVINPAQQHKIATDKIQMEDVKLRPGREGSVASMPITQTCPISWYTTCYRCFPASVQPGPSCDV